MTEDIWVLGGYQSELAPLLGEEGQHPAHASAAIGRFRLHRAVCAWLRGMTGESPAGNGPGRAIAIILDDLHRADAETLGLLTAVAEELAGTRILLVAALSSRPRRTRTIRPRSVRAEAVPIRRRTTSPYSGCPKRTLTSGPS